MLFFSVRTIPDTVKRNIQSEHVFVSGLVLGLEDVGAFVRRLGVEQLGVEFGRGLRVRAWRLFEVRA